ncbi:hypothetical protein [Flavobacterium sp. PL02]|uniref:hypothetical protein n=1 Tax=Flavobacterium sp. PL02 TaxID=3088354 RepID=UPI002B23B5F6|nr:hypothetical protein [Flavobacterium sp. PL02]MEA9415080.1 hypothetical protein [Flavobacterium sp. PL02]
MRKDDISLSLSDIVNSDFVNDNQSGAISFDDLFTSFVFNQFELTERMDIQLIWSYYSKALNECKQNRLTKADYFYTKGLEALNNSDLNERAKLYLNVYIYPNLAFRVYKDKNYEKALELLLLAIQNIEIIEKEYPDIYAAKIQQIHNVIRLFLRANKSSDYIDLNIAIIEHILLEVEPIKNKYNLKNSILNQTKLQYKEEMLMQIFTEFLVTQMTIDTQSFDFDFFCKSLNEKKHNTENKYLNDWLALVSLINDNSQDIALLLKDVLKKDYKYAFFKIYVLNALLNKSFLYLQSEDSIQNVKALTATFTNQIHDKNILEKIQKASKINIK